MKTIKNMTADELRKSILQLAIQGKLVKQNPNDEPASVLVDKIYEEKKKLIAEGKIKKEKEESRIFKGDDNRYYEKIGKNEPVDITDNLPFDIPDSWEWIRLGNTSYIYNGNSINENEKQKKYTNLNEGYNYIATKDVSFDRTINYNNGIKIPYDTQFKIAPSGNVLMCIEGGSAGRKIAILNEDVCFGNKLACFQNYFDVSKYLFSYLQSPTFSQIFKGEISGIIGGVSINTLKSLYLPLPPLEEQKRIVEKIEELEPYIKKYDSLEKQLTKLENEITDKLKKSILQYAIQGKLVKQDPNDEPASVLLERIKAEKEKLIKEGKIKRDKNESFIYQGDDKNYYENLPENWALCTLNELGNYKKGPFGSSLTKSMFISPEMPNAVKVYEQKNAIYKDYSLGNYYISYDKYLEMKSFEIFPNDFIVSCAGTIGEIYQLPGNAPKGIINQALMKITLYDNDISEMFKILLDNALRTLSKESKGTAIKNIPPFDILKNHIIMIPPLKEQSLIINKLNYLNNLLSD